jgi:3-keto-5-aminohexanoate cleavage enzyme
VYLQKGVLADSNAQLMEKMVRIARELGREPATPDEARAMLKLRRPER